MSSEAQHAEERVVDTATGAEAPAEISEERVQHIFSNIAKQYARFNAVSSFGLFKGWLRKTVDAANLTSESDLLDLAGGTGDVSYMAASRRPGAYSADRLISRLSTRKRFLTPTIHTTP